MTTEPTDRDREMAAKICNEIQSQDPHWLNPLERFAEGIAASRDEGRREERERWIAARDEFAANYPGDAWCLGDFCGWPDSPIDPVDADPPQ